MQDHVSPPLALREGHLSRSLSTGHPLGSNHMERICMAMSAMQGVMGERLSFHSKNDAVLSGMTISSTK